MTALRIRPASILPSCVNSERNTDWWLNPGCIPASKISVVDAVMMPSPPNCIRMMMNQCPVSVNVEEMSTTESPVTQTADMDVKNASIKLMGRVAACGMLRSAVPIAIRRRYASTTSMMGLDCVLVLKTFSDSESANIWYFDRSIKQNLVKLNSYSSSKLEKDLACRSRQGPLCKEETFVIYSWTQRTLKRLVFESTWKNLALLSGSSSEGLK